MKVCVVTVGIGGWYPRGVMRLLKSFTEVSPEIPVLSWVNVLPPNAPDYPGSVPYGVKPFALLEAQRQGYDIAIWLDAAFRLIKPLDPLIAWIAANRYFLCRNGHMVGTWCADSALETLKITREESFTIEEASSYCVGLNLGSKHCQLFLKQWAKYAADGKTFPGFHSNVNRWNYDGSPQRSEGFVSEDPRVLGHRHDQTAASVIAWRLGMSNLVERPIFTAYDVDDMEVDERTVLLNRGGNW